jgi:selenocysteine lyase/cysteine desulfurase
MDKRSFLKQASALSAAAFAPFAALASWVDGYGHYSAAALAHEEDFWLGIRQDYRLKPDYINLENGYYCCMPQTVLEQYLEHLREVNYQSSYYMRTVQFENKKKIASKLAAVAGCAPDELIITRNTTESLDMVISGMDWQPGDEAVMAAQDYGAMLDMFAQVAKRHGVVNKIISIPNHTNSDEEIVDLYARAITPKTKLLMVCHMINITGQILPIRKICDMAHNRGVPVMVDGAHAFAHIQFSIADLNCDYYGASLHKWLSAPLGAGILYVRKENINKIWPLFGEEGRRPDDILRLNHTGTHPVATDLAIENALDYHQKIGIERKEARLRYLQNYWTSRVRPMRHVVLNTPEAATRSCAIANVGIKGMSPSDMAKTLLNKHKIWTVAIDSAGVHGCRITPNVYTSTRDLDKLIEAIALLG